MGNAKSVCELVTFDFDLESYFFVFFVWLDLATSFPVWRYIFRVSRAHLSFKIMGPGSWFGSRKSDSLQLKNYLFEIAGT